MGDLLFLIRLSKSGAGSCVFFEDNSPAGPAMRNTHWSIPQHLTQPDDLMLLAMRPNEGILNFSSFAKNIVAFFDFVFLLPELVIFLL
jgi:hypothetical protein